MESAKNYLNDFVYDTKLKNLGVFSRQYFNSILYSMYQDFSDDQLFCFTFGDFNKLNQLNKTHSFEIGDKAIFESIRLIKETLPEDTMIVRIAGDEFGFLTPNVYKRDMDSAFQYIDTALKEHSEDVYGLTITTSSMDSSVYPTFDELYAHTELNVNRKKKLNNKNKFKTPEEMLSDSIYKGLTNYFSYYRIESTSLPIEYYGILKNSLLDVVIHNLEKTNDNMVSYVERLKSIMPESAFESKLDIDPEIASQIHNYIINNDNSSINKTNKVNELFKFLITDPLTGEVSKNFFDNYVIPLLAESKHEPISVRLFDLTHLKLSNDIIGHNQTDENINELYSKLISQIKDEGTNDSISNNKKSNNKYFASAGNCGLLLIENSNTAIPDNKIDGFINTALANERILSLTTSSRVCEPSQIVETIKQLETDCKEKKEQQKLAKIASRETIIPLNLALGDSIYFYKKNISNPYSMASKQMLVNTLFQNLNKVLAEQFPKQSLNIFRDNEYSNPNDER